MLEAKSIVGKFPKIEAEHLLIQIPEEMKLFDADVCAFESALEQAPEVFESISVNLSVNIAFRVVDNLMLEILILQSLIGVESIGVDGAMRFDVAMNLGFDVWLAAIGNHGSANLSAAFQHANNWSLILAASFGDAASPLVGVHESSSTTDEGFIYLHLLSMSADFGERIILHRKTNPVQHEPCGLLSDAKSTRYFVGTDPVLTVRNHPHCGKPLVERQSRVLKDGADLHAELFLSVLLFAFPHPTSGDKANVITATSGAFNAIGPTALDHEVEAVVGVGEVDDGLLEGLWLGAHGVPHCQSMPETPY